jgi:hypothetical protein
MEEVEDLAQEGNVEVAMHSSVLVGKERGVAFGDYCNLRKARLAQLQKLMRPRHQ